MTLPQPDVLQATLSVDGQAWPLCAASLRVSITAQGLYQPALPGQGAEIDLHARLEFETSAGKTGFLVTLPPEPLGMSLGGAEDAAALLVVMTGHDCQSPHVQLEQCRVEALPDGALYVVAQGTAADGRAIHLTLQGRPTHVQVEVMPTAGAAGARAWCQQALPYWNEGAGVISEGLSNDEGPARWALDWRESRWAAQEEAADQLHALRLLVDRGVEGPLVPQEFLSGTAACNGTPKPLAEMVFDLSVSTVDDSQGDGNWLRLPQPVYSASAVWYVEGKMRWFTLRIPARLLGFDSGPREAAEVPQLKAAFEEDDHTHTEQPTVDVHVLVLGGGRYEINARATLADGSTWHLQLAGHPLFFTAYTPPSDSNEEAQSLLRTLHLTETELDIGTLETKRLPFVCMEWQPSWLDAIHSYQWAALRQRASAESSRREREEATALAVSRAQPIPQPSPELPLVAGRRAWAVEEALLVLGMDAQGLASYVSLELVPTSEDEDPGDDDALCPSLLFESETHWSVELPVQGQWQHLHEGTDLETDAWYGNDAPALDNNRLSWRLISKTEAEVRWEAEYDDWHTTRQTEALVYVGRARFRQRDADD